MNDRRVGLAAACVFATIALAISLLPGCSKTGPASANVGPPDGVEITLVDRAEFDAVLVRLAGKVVLVDCWATWCLPCIEQLPHSVELAERHRDAGLAVVTLSFDDPDAADGVRAVLERVRATRAINLQSQLGGSPQSMDAFEVASGALPHYKLYDRAGKLRRTFELDPSADRQFTTADVDSAVAELLAE